MNTFKIFLICLIYLIRATMFFFAWILMLMVSILSEHKCYGPCKTHQWSSWNAFPLHLAAALGNATQMCYVKHTASSFVYLETAYSYNFRRCSFTFCIPFLYINSVPELRTSLKQDLSLATISAISQSSYYKYLSTVAI